MFEETIAAIATAQGEGGIAVVRISGPQALHVAGRVFVPRANRPITSHKGYTVHYGCVVRPPEAEQQAERIDDALLTLFRAPHSYTGEDVCEISCHGGSAAPRIVLELTLNAGARLAEPGEFTLRAFMNGRMDLAQAEAVADLVRARTESARRLARRQLDGDLSRAVASLRDDLIGIIAAIEVTIDFSDEVGELDHADIEARLRAAQGRVERLHHSADTGRILRDGLRVVIFGRPNVGKSSLLNALLRNDRAIVTPVAGTTRDTIEECAQIGGLQLVLTDTAGLRKTEDEVERIGVERTRAAIESAEVALLVLDCTAGFTHEDAALLAQCGGAGSTMAVWNKCDLAENSDALPVPAGLSTRSALRVSATTGAGLETLERAITAPFKDAADRPDSAVVSSLRHKQALAGAHVSLGHAVKSAEARMPGDFIVLDARGALDALGLITGETVTDDIVHRIFRDFCVGK